MPLDKEMESPSMELLDDLDLDVSGHSHLIEAQIEHFLDTFKKQGLSPWHDSSDSVDTIGLIIPRHRTLVRSSSDSSYYSTETSPSVEDQVLTGLVRDPSCSTNCTFTSFVSSANSEVNYIKSFLGELFISLLHFEIHRCSIFYLNLTLCIKASVWFGSICLVSS